MCTPDVDAKRPPLKPKSPAPPTAVKPCPSTATVRIRAADGTSEPCPLVVASGSIQLKAVGSKPGTSAWSTTSARIKLQNANSDTVTIVAQGVTSDARNAEVVKVEFTPEGEAALAPVSIGVSVIFGAFQKAPDTAYGFDDMLAVAQPADPHASVKEAGWTRLHLLVAGGAEMADLKFISDAGAIATADRDPDEAAPAGTVLISAGSTGHTTIRAVCACDASQEVARVHVDVYKESVWTFRVSRIWDSRSELSRLRTPVLDVEAIERGLQNVYKRAVLVGRVVDVGEGKPIDVPFDDPRCGSLLFIPPHGGPMFSVVRGAIRGSGGGTTVSLGVVRDMRVFYPLAKDAKKDDTTVEIWQGVGARWMSRLLHPDQPTFALSTAHGIPTAPTYGVLRVDGFIVQLASPLREDHAVGAGLSHQMHGISGDPQFILEQHDDREKGEVGTEMEAATLAHEGLHQIGKVRSVLDKGNIMHWEASPGRDLAFHEVPLAYEDDRAAGGEPMQQQWDDIERP